MQITSLAAYTSETKNTMKGVSSGFTSISYCRWLLLAIILRARKSFLCVCFNKVALTRNFAAFLILIGRKKMWEFQGGRCLQGNRWFSPPASMTSLVASVTFKMVSKVFIKETGKNFEFIMEILFRFLRFRDFKIPIDIEKTRLWFFFGMKRPVV